ncbi:hypothetical protein [Telluribacter sp. SYSU D00476]|uniref:hypothetical protein n=1 Tax=Telluribacter sp. SYSU D00476 TaxID=2811430 RepID=UPI001FF4580D|nr:hypothetical protein [Telluribacter sp. SYSU D00476]
MIHHQQPSETSDTVYYSQLNDQLAFPGPWIGGVSLILGPLLILTGALLRIQFHFFFPQQLAAFATHPALITAAYSLYSLGNVILCFGILYLVAMIGKWNRVWAIWAGVLVVSGLFTRTFHAGIDHMAFQLVRVQNVELATKAVSDSYRAFHVFRYLNGYIMLGWICIAIASYRSRTLNMFSAIALGMMVIVPFGTLKGTEIRAVGILGLCIALVPLGIRVLRQAPPLSRRAKIWVTIFIVVELIFVPLSIIFPALMN